MSQPGDDADGSHDQRQKDPQQPGPDRRPGQPHQRKRLRPGGRRQAHAQAEETERRVEGHRDRLGAVEQRCVRAEQVAEAEDQARHPRDQATHARDVTGPTSTVSARRAPRPRCWPRQTRSRSGATSCRWEQARTVRRERGRTIRPRRIRRRRRTRSTQDADQADQGGTQPGNPRDRRASRWRRRPAPSPGR